MEAVKGRKNRNSRSQMFFKIGDFKYFANFAEKHLCWCLFLIKLQSFFYKTASVAASGKIVWKAWTTNMTL